MRILYDGQIFNSQAAGGINRYFANLIGRLPPDFQPVITTYRVPEVNWPRHPHLRVEQFKIFRPERLAYQMARPYFQNVARRGHFQIAHPTYYHLLANQDIGGPGCPVVLTVYDMIYELLGDSVDFENHGFVVEAKRKAILKADAILCISQNTKRDLLELYPSVEPKITVTPLATELDEGQAHGPHAVPENPYFLFVGARAGYKNFEVMLVALAQVAGSHPEVALCLVGSPLGEAEQRRLSELKLAGRVHHFSNIGDDHLAKLYRCAVALVYPSLYEGFGIPPLEAMACGTLVVASNTSSLPEVVGEAGLLFDPKKPDELTAILESLLAQTEDREAMIARGRLQAAKFSWDEMAAQTVEVYLSVAS